MKKVCFISSEKYMEHKAPSKHPESPARISAILDHLKKQDIYKKLIHIPPAPINISYVEFVHDKKYIERVKIKSKNAPALLDADTYVSEKTFDTALLAAGALQTACDELMAENVDRAFCAVRPPGHHAESDRGMGFCIFNNAAIAARYLQKKHNIKKIFVIDWDVHHGNGTQQIFYDEQDVFYFSVHQYPFYPGTGAAREFGTGYGMNTTLNVPLPGGQGDLEYEGVIVEKCLPAIQQFSPGLILISAGFDAHRDDPLGGMNVTEKGFANMTRLVCGTADKVCSGRVISLLEGGYNLEALSKSVQSHLEALTP